MVAIVAIIIDLFDSLNNILESCSSSKWDKMNQIKNNQNKFPSFFIYIKYFLIQFFLRFIKKIKNK